MYFTEGSKKARQTYIALVLNVWKRVLYIDLLPVEKKTTLHSDVVTHFTTSAWQRCGILDSYSKRLFLPRPSSLSEKRRNIKERWTVVDKTLSLLRYNFVSTQYLGFRIDVSSPGGFRSDSRYRIRI